MTITDIIGIFIVNAIMMTISAIITTIVKGRFWHFCCLGGLLLAGSPIWTNFPQQFGAADGFLPTDQMMASYQACSSTKICTRTSLQALLTLFVCVKACYSPKLKTPTCGHTALYAWVGPIYIMGMRANLVQKISFKMPGKVYIVNLLTAIYLLWKFWWSAVSKLALPWKFQTTFCWCLIKICVTKSNLHKNGLCSQEQLLKTILL